MTWAQVQTPAITSASALATSIATPYGSNVTAGDLLVAVVSYGSNNLDPSIADTLGNTWTRVPATHLWHTATSQGAALFYTISGSSGANTVTVSWTVSADWRSLAVHEYSGANASPVVDVTPVTVDNQAASLTPTTGSITPTTNGCLIFSYLNDVDGTGALTQPTNFTKRTDSTGNANNIFTADWVQATAGAINPTWSSTVSVQHEGITVAFRPSAGGTNATVIPPARTDVLIH